jgi:hypothetical protein
VFLACKYCLIMAKYSNKSDRRRRRYRSVHTLSSSADLDYYTCLKSENSHSLLTATSHDPVTAACHFVTKMRKDEVPDVFVLAPAHGCTDGQRVVWDKDMGKEALLTPLIVACLILIVVLEAKMYNSLETSVIGMVVEFRVIQSTSQGGLSMVYAFMGNCARKDTFIQKKGCSLG